MSTYGGVPDDAPTFGTAFNYAVWSAGTEISFHNVPWNNDYRDIVQFPDTDGRTLDEYLTSVQGSVTFAFATYAKAYEPVRVGLPFNYVYQFNYIRVHNPSMPVGFSSMGGDTPRTFYYFIQDIRFLAPETTEIVVQLDVWQTFGNMIEFGNCYVERGHIGVANERQFADNGREFLTIPEGFDVGNEYYVDAVYTHDIANRTVDAEGKRQYFIAVWTVTDIASGQYGTLTEPKLNISSPTRFEGLPHGIDCLLFDDHREYQKMLTILKNYPWISQGIVAVMILPVFNSPNNEGPYKYYTVTVPEGSFRYKFIYDDMSSQRLTLKDDWRDAIDLGDRYRHLHKFKTFPYCSVELTTYSGTPLVLKPECMVHRDLRVVQISHLTLPSPRIMFYPYRYNAVVDRSPDDDKDEELTEWFMDHGHGHDNAEFMDMMTGITNFPTFSVANDQYRNYLASNANSIAYQYTQADWSQQRALTANQLAYDQGGASINAARSTNANEISAATEQMNLANDTAKYRGITGAVVDTVGIAGGRSAIGALASAGGQLANTAITMNQQTQATTISNTLASARTNIATSNAGYQRDTNKDYADFAAKGDYSTAIAAINAKVQDAKLIQPSTVGQVGGEAFNLVAFRWSLHAKVKRITTAAQVAIGEFWLRYGYSVNRFAVPPRDLTCMSHFTYWKMRETYLSTAPMPETYKQAIRGIFEKGVTVWTNPGFVGNIDMGVNEPVEGIVL